MRIGIDARSLLEPQPSGVSIYTAELLQALLALPNRTDTFCLFTSGWKKPLLHYPNVEWQHLPVPNKLVALHLAPSIDRWLGSLDVLFMPNWNFYSVTKQCPVVLTVHDCSINLYPQLSSTKQRLWHRFIHPARQIRQAHHLIAVSETTRQDCIQWYNVPPSQITTIYSGAPSAVEPIPVADLPEQYVVVVGTGGGRKNIELVKQSHWSLPVVVIGEDGYLSAGEKWYVIQHAQALLYGSLYEGFGFPPLEAWQAGVPVIASAAGAIPEICGEAALYVNPYSQTDIAQAVQTIVTDASIRSRLIAAGQQRLQRYRWDETARATLQVLHQAVY